MEDGLPPQDYAELLKELLVSQSDLSYFREIPLALQEKIYEEIKAYVHRTEELQKPVYRVMAAATKFIPNFIIARLALDFLTPYIIAQVTLHLEPRESANIGKSFPPDYLGKVALYVEPALSAQIADLMGLNHVQKIFEEMVKFRFFRKLGEISDHIADRLLIDLVLRMPDNEALAHISVHMQNRDKIRRTAKVLPPGKKGEIGYHLQKLTNDKELIAIFLNGNT
ncbi:MAG: hypothetical protein NZM25_05065 [Leptospiraceae bacterium]|nr:hypothetical protein [Leptospiraceae bacterium]MDW8305622.1 hypothetical protein [Leptospiraceae bacterium]